MTETRTRPEKIPYGQGIYHRRIRATSSPGLVNAELEDDFHHFRVRLQHDGEKIVEIEGDAVRYPWTTCPGATTP